MRCSMFGLCAVAASSLFAVSAEAATIYSSSFADLSGWSTFGTPAAVTLDDVNTASLNGGTDGRTVYYNSDANSSTQSIIQRALPSSVAMSAGQTPSVTFTVRRNNYSTGYVRVNLFQSPSNAHAAGDVQSVDLYMRSYDGNLQLNVSRFDDGINPNVSVTTERNAVLTNGKLPPATNAVDAPVASDYTTFTLSMPASGFWTLTDSRIPGVDFTLNLGSEAGLFDTMRIDIANGNGTNSAFLMDSISVDVTAVPEPASLGAMGLAAGVMLRRRRA